MKRSIAAPSARRKRDAGQNFEGPAAKKNPVRTAFQTGQAELVVASDDARSAIPPAPPDDSSVPDIGYKASVDKNPPGVNRRAAPFKKCDARPEYASRISEQR